jgi:hypothetical protein
MGIPAYFLLEKIGFVGAYPAVNFGEGAHPVQVVHSITHATMVWCDQVVPMSELTTVVAPVC